VLTEEPIVIGRKKKDVQRYGYRGTAYIGRVVLGKGEALALGRPVLLDISESHVILVLGKRGYGKSYTLGVILEEFDRLPFSVRGRLSVVNVDTAGVFWSSKFPNKEDEELLKQWGLTPRGMQNLLLYVPKKVLDHYRKAGIPVDGAFLLNPAELSLEEWLWLLKLNLDHPAGSLLAEIYEEKGEIEDIDALIASLGDDEVSRTLKARLKIVKGWEIFDPSAPSVKEYLKPGKIVNIDVSTFRGDRRLPSIVVSLIGRRLFEERMLAKKGEDAALLRGESPSSMPIVWMVVDEAHLFAPRNDDPPSREVLRIWAKVGRQPGLGMILATQQPSDLDDGIITQADVFISHRLTSKLDLDALAKIKPTYIPEALDKEISRLGHEKGLAIVLDDVTERILLIKVRPRMSLHAGSSASALRTSYL